MQVGLQLAAAALAALPTLPLPAEASLELSSTQQRLQAGSQQLPSFPDNLQLPHDGDASSAAAAAVQVGACNQWRNLYPLFFCIRSMHDMRGSMHA